MKVLLSIKPEFAERIFNGEKRFEFRKSIFKNEDVNEVYVYVTAPVKQIVGKFSAVRIYCDTPANIWNLGKEYAGIDKERFFEYFAGKDTAYAIEISDAMRFSSPINPKEIIEKFVPPQSFCYFDDANAQLCA